MTVFGLSAGPVAAAATKESDMDLDLSEYDQVDEVKSLAAWATMGPHIPSNNSNNNSNKRDSPASTNSDPTSTNNNDDNSASENDFVFLPAPPRQHESQTQQTTDTGDMASIQSSQVKPSSDGIHEVRKAQSYTIVGPNCLPHIQDQSTKLSDIEQQYRSTTTTSYNNNNNYVPVRSQPVPSTPLSIINANLGLVCNNNNPFDNNANCLKQQQQINNAIGSPSKPIGVLEVSSSVNVSGTIKKLDDLMHQIVTRSDLIYIEIPCAYCHEPVACPPTDISAWLNHMSRAHNCKVCPICNKMIGLGPRCDLDIMRRHVVAHLDDDWLNRRAARTNFTFGLQQQWFSGSRCNVKDAKYR